MKEERKDKDGTSIMERVEKNMNRGVKEKKNYPGDINWPRH